MSHFYTNLNDAPHTVYSIPIIRIQFAGNLSNFTYIAVYSNAYSTLTRQTRIPFDNIYVTNNKLY